MIEFVPFAAFSLRVGRTTLSPNCSPLLNQWTIGPVFHLSHSYAALKGEQIIQYGRI